MLTERTYYRSQLVSFALSADAVTEAREAICGGASSSIERDETELSVVNGGRAATNAVTDDAAAAMAAASDARFEALSDTQARGR